MRLMLLIQVLEGYDNFHLISLRFYVLACFQGRFHLLPVKSTIFQFEGRRECLIRKRKQGIERNFKDC
jgi:hypothetical protein